MEHLRISSKFAWINISTDQLVAMSCDLVLPFLLTKFSWLLFVGFVGFNCQGVLHPAPFELLMFQVDTCNFDRLATGVHRKKTPKFSTRGCTHFGHQTVTADEQNPASQLTS